MNKFFIFGGTTEGRKLAEFLEEKKIPALMSVATEYGEGLLPSMQCVTVRTGRLDGAKMTSLLKSEQPKIVIDATHPYAAEASRTIDSACRKCNLPLLRVKRENTTLPDGSILMGDQMPECFRFDNMKALTSWLNQTSGIIFSTLGAKEAGALSQVDGFRQRIWLRTLPLTESLEAARNAGFPSNHLICMQGPFSSALNEAMFRETEATILLTKASGKAGGFWEKLAAAGKCNMTVAILSRPEAITPLSTGISSDPTATATLSAADSSGQSTITPSSTIISPDPTSTAPLSAAITPEPAGQRMMIDAHVEAAKKSEIPATKEISLEELKTYIEKLMENENLF